MAKQEKDAGEELWEVWPYMDERDRTELLEDWHEEYAKIVRAELAERRKEPLDNLEEQEIVELLNGLEDEEQEDFLKIVMIKLGRRIAEMKEEEERELHFQQGAEEQQDKGAWRKTEIVKFVWLLIFTAGIIYVIIAMVAGWLRILHGIIALFILFGCIKAML